jgi:uridine phosphorylase
MTWLITPEQTLSAARRAGLGDKALRLSGIAVLTFSKATVERLETLCGLQDAAWLGPQHHPYAAAHIVKQGSFEGLDVTVLVPPMGSSPLACIVEDLAACGVQAVFLVCAAWSLGPPLHFGDLIVPSISLGRDGTSIHYGNEQGAAHASSAVVDALATACRERGIRHHVGGNATCEALYRITPQMAEDFRQDGCLCMDNGEASTLFAMAGALNLVGGVLFQPYIELAAGWDPARLGDERYRDACRLQAEIVLQASVRLRQQGLLDRAKGEKNDTREELLNRCSFAAAAPGATWTSLPLQA